MLQGIVTDIQRFSVHDGDGIRTTVFLKGCQMNCFWCHNPETISPQQELQVNTDECIGCLACISFCPYGALSQIDGNPKYSRERCRACGACAVACYAHARVLVGRSMSINEVVAELIQDKDFYDRSGGGITLSGGEPLLQMDFTIGILKRCQQLGIKTAIETNLSWPWEQIVKVLPHLDMLMMDVKLIDPIRHKEATGANNRQILDNLRRLSKENIPVIIRTPIIPGVNDTVEDIGAIADYLSDMPNLIYYELLPYHPLGTGKNKTLGNLETKTLIPPSNGLMHSLAEAARQRNITVRIAGEATTNLT
jgi:pyruvate formate lyase activating enzyme